MRKKIYIICIFILATTNSFAQRVGIGTINPANSAQLEIASTSKGLLIPRVSLSSETDVATVPSPAISLIVYNTNTYLPDSAGYYYWGGTKWLKLLTNTTAGGDLSGTYPNPVVSKLNNVPLPTEVLNSTYDGKTLRYNTISKSYELRFPVEASESIIIRGLVLTNQTNRPGKIQRGNDNSNLLPLCFGKYIGSGLSGQTDNVSFSKFADGIYQFHIDPVFFGNISAFNPIIVCSIIGTGNYGFISSYINGPSDFVIETRTPTLQTYADIYFSFVVYNQ
jgi:hypothetical protein